MLSSDFMHCLQKKLIIKQSECKQLIDKLRKSSREQIDYESLNFLLPSYRRESKNIILQIKELTENMEICVTENKSLKLNMEYERILKSNVEEFTILQKSMRKAMLECERVQETNERNYLLSGKKTSGPREDVKSSENQLVKSLKLTENMHDCVSRLSGLLSQSHENNRSALESSEKILENQSELRDMKTNLQVSKRLSLKFSRRQVTDLIIYFLTFSFFYLTCAYIIMSRLFK